VGTNITLTLPTQVDADRLRSSLGQQPANSQDVAISDVNVLQQIMATMRRLPNSTDISFVLNQQSFTATVQAGPGGNYLSNEVSYRVLRSGQGAQPFSFHVHTLPGQPVPQDGDPAVGHAQMKVRQTLITTLQQVIVAAARRAAQRHAKP
jgi:hypothetical protein